MDETITQLVVNLAHKIEAADADLRAELQPQLHGMIEALREHGVDVPPALKYLDAELVDEIIEDQFDNMPI